MVYRKRGGDFFQGRVRLNDAWERVQRWICFWSTPRLFPHQIMLFCGIWFESFFDGNSKVNIIERTFIWAA
jgi:hypothetical protein